MKVIILSESKMFVFQFEYKEEKNQKKALLKKQKKCIHTGQWSVLTKPENQAGESNQLQLSKWGLEWDCSISSKAFAANSIQKPRGHWLLWSH